MNGRQGESKAWRRAGYRFVHVRKINCFAAVLEGRKWSAEESIDKWVKGNLSLIIMRLAGVAEGRWTAPVSGPRVMVSGKL